MSEPTICLTFDFDAMCVWWGALGLKSPGPLSRGEFGARVGTPRILKVLAENDVKATFFIPGHTIDTWPDLCREIRDAGHEIGHHGYMHEAPGSLDPERERKVLERGLAAMRKHLDITPRGYRSPAWDLSDKTLSYLREYEFAYDSSLLATDFEPYWCREGDVFHEDAAFQFGKEIELVEIPGSWSLDDLPQYEFIVTKTGIWPGSANPRQMQERWLEELDFMAEEIPEGVFNMTFHPQSTGRGARIRVLEAMIQRGRELGARFARMGEAADEWAAAHKLRQ
jgi:peptidoglycan/xylan/chitin deacetylase (PgdA/CDA1 family)